MGLKEDLTSEVRKIFRDKWEERDGRVVPEPKDVGLANVGVNLDATVLYADIDGSTSMVDTKHKQFAAEVYKTYLLCAVRIIKAEGGVVTAYDGDRVMAVFIGDSKNTTAVRTGLKIKSAVVNIINPLIKEVRNSDFVLRQVVGIDTSTLMAAQTGIRGTNDLVWVGRAANWAAKMCSISEQPYQTIISDTVFKNMNDEVKYSSAERKLMWEHRSWKGRTVYRSSWSWKVSS
jgi:class 3 adenylate cyclase